MLFWREASVIRTFAHLREEGYNIEIGYQRPRLYIAREDKQPILLEEVHYISQETFSSMPVEELFVFATLVVSDFCDTDNN